jgi:hypothetical protein
VWCAVIFRSAQYMLRFLARPSKETVCDRLLGSEDRLGHAAQG